jgi:hypothetical protein
VIDSDLGMSDAAVDHRQAFKDLVARVTLGEVGISCRSLQRVLSAPDAGWTVERKPPPASGDGAV